MNTAIEMFNFKNRIVYVFKKFQCLKARYIIFERTHGNFQNYY